MMEELGAEDEAGVSSWAFVLRSHADSLGGRFPKEVLGAIFGLKRFLPKIWKDFGEKNERIFVDMRKGRREDFKEERVSTLS